MRKIWIITDTHFGHYKLSEEFKERPSDFSERIIKNCINMIGNDDILIHLGDFCIGKDEKKDVYWHRRFFEYLFCKKILVLGNHDHKSDSWYYDHGWDFVCKQFVGKYFGHRTLFSHRPKVKIADTSLNIHGHSHGNAHRDEEYCNFYDVEYHKEIALEHTEYKPVLLQTFIEKIDNGL